MLYSAYENGLPVKYMEMGNEEYGRDKNYYLRFPTVKNYVSEMNDWAGAIKSHNGPNGPFSDLQIAVTSAYSDAFGTQDHGRKKLWNKFLLEELAGFGTLNIDAVTFHIYLDAATTGSPANVGQALDAPQIQAMLNRPFESSASIKKNEFALLHQILPGLGIWMTEYNLEDGAEYSTHGTWAHGLFASAMTLSWLEEPNVEKVTLHTASHTGVYGAFFNRSGRAWLERSPGAHAKRLYKPDDAALAGHGQRQRHDAAFGSLQAQPLCAQAEFSVPRRKCHSYRSRQCTGSERSFLRMGISQRPR
jgi:hypothetical protein